MSRAGAPPTPLQILFYRFKDIDDLTRAEYMLMATFLSLAIALAVELAATRLLGLILATRTMCRKRVLTPLQAGRGKH